jgi:hypothetical protein
MGQPRSYAKSESTSPSASLAFGCKILRPPSVWEQASETAGSARRSATCSGGAFFHFPMMLKVNMSQSGGMNWMPQCSKRTQKKTASSVEAWISMA